MDKSCLSAKGVFGLRSWGKNLTEGRKAGVNEASFKAGVKVYFKKFNFSVKSQDTKSMCKNHKHSCTPKIDKQRAKS